MSEIPYEKRIHGHLKILEDVIESLELVNFTKEEAAKLDELAARLSAIAEEGY